MEKHRLDIAIFCAGMEVNPKTLQEKSLGGSETAGISMAHELAKRGHHVCLFCNTNEEVMHDGVRYINIDKFQPYVTSCPHDVLIGQRIPEVFRSKLQSKINILWQHDVALKSQRQNFHGSLWNIDRVFCLSDWHVKQYQDIYQIEEDELFFQTSNGVKLIEKPSEKNRKPKRLVYTNRPERGLDNLLFNIMPELWKEDPEIELCIAGYDNTHPDMEQFYNMCYSKIAEYQKQGYKIAHLGSLNKKDLYELYKTARLYVYPTAFHETSCITAMESQMCGVPMITSHIGALPETLCNDSNVLIFQDYQRNENYNKQFIKAVLDLLNDQSKITEMQKGCYKKAKEFDWKHVAEKWENLFFEIFDDKTANNDRLARHLYAREDIMTLKYLNRKDLAHADDLDQHYSYLDDKDQYIEKYKKLGEEYAQIEENIELRNYARVDVALNDMQTYLQEKKIKDPKILDFASGICNESILFANNFNASVDAVNISDQEHEVGEKMIEKHLQNGEVNQITGSGADCLDHKYDAMFLGEILEHQPKPEEFIMQFDKHLKDDALVVITVPFGLWEDERHAHVWNFERADLEHMFMNKENTQIRMVSGAINQEKQESLGWWVVSYKQNHKPINPVDMERKLKIQNPKETVSVCMIVKNEENMLHRCLKSVKPFATEIIINDTGSTDSTLDIAKQYDAKIIHGKSPLEIGFDEARNESIKHAKSDWILWLDADEEVIDHQYLLKYLRPNIFAGYSIKQHHFTVDAGETKVDTPVRLFRNGRTIRFYGFVHEHPEREGMVNEGVGASTLLGDVNIAHDGYFSERRRRGRFNRNIQLMFKEFKQNPDRLLTKFLMIRDYVHIARYELEKNQNKLTPYAIKCLQDGIDLYRSSFLDNATNYTEEATMFYSEILRMLNMGLEYRINLNVGHSNVKPDQLDSVVRFADNEEFMKYLKMKVEEKAEPHEGIFL
jgi:glycosyltransferase involved in cell wall biosynthesis/2-polyprenyl-3-methyl-5-hydroxy-6-metoxy-1,4-benzoquinol methylase